MIHQDFWFEPAKLYRLSPTMRRTHLLTGSVNALIDAALADDSGAGLLIESDSGGMLVDHEIVRAACDLTRPRRLQPGDLGWLSSVLRIIDRAYCDVEDDSDRFELTAETGSGPITILLDTEGAALRERGMDDETIAAAAIKYIREHGLPTDRIVRLSGIDLDRRR